MNFVHDESGFDSLLTQVADQTGIAPALVEKDYWITHALWALHETGLDLWLKGGTSLSKGFGIIERFSEDLDLMVERGRVAALADDMLAQLDVAALPSADDPSLVLDNPAKHAVVAQAYARIAPMFWGPRLPLDEACRTLREWVAASLGG